jgi:Domain of unknown function (DUF5615)
MIRLATDADIPKSLIRASRQALASIDLVRVQEVGLRQAPDEAILEWSARENRILISFDRNTMVAAANQRVLNGLRMPGLIMPARNMRLRQMAEEIAIIVACSKPEELEGKVFFLPI